MKYAAKKTWPEKSAVWEHEGNADTAQAFAVEFAAIEQLAVDVEFLVMEREGNGEIQFFRVAGLSPSQVVPTEARATGTSNPMHVDQTAAPAADETPEPLGMPSLRPAINMLIYMAKVSLGAILVVGVLGYLMVKVIAPAFG